MPRVNTYEVKDIIETSLIDLTPFITAANLIVTEKLTGKHSDALLKEIERWLAAHFLTAKERQKTKRRVGESEDSWNWNSGQGLDSSTYGQTVKSLDTSGILFSSLGKSQMVFEVMMDLPTD